MLTLALTALVAHAVPADMDVACMPLQITQTSPTANAIDVPVDANLSLLFDGDCGGSSDWLIEVVDGSGTALVSETWTWDGAVPSMATIDPASDLPANAALTLRATPSDGGYWSELVEVPFTTGEAHVHGIVGLPTVAITDATWTRTAQYAETTLDITPADDPDHLSVIKVQSDSVIQYLPGTAPMVGQYFGWGQPLKPDQLCVTVTQIDGAGNASEPVEACADPVIVHVSGGGCLGGRTTPVAPMSEAFLVLGGLGLLRRRKS